jgi:hypothetical protein
MRVSNDMRGLFGGDIKYKLRAVIFDFKYDRLSQDDLIDLLVEFNQLDLFEVIDSTLVTGILRAKEYVIQNKIEKTKPKSKFYWSYSLMHEPKFVLLQRLKECIDAIVSGELKQEDVVTILTSRDFLNGEWIDEIDRSSVIENDYEKLFLMVKGAILQANLIKEKEQTKLQWTFAHTKNQYANNDLFSSGHNEDTILNVGLENFRKNKKRLGWEKKIIFTPLEVEAMYQVFKIQGKKLSEVEKTDIDKAKELLTRQGYSDDFPAVAKKSKK